MDREEMKSALREVLREELGPSEVDMAEKWEGGEIVIRSGQGTPREKRLPIESFFRKIVTLRDRLRIVEQFGRWNRLPRAVATYSAGAVGGVRSTPPLIASP